ncbi:helix-turn-helix domain-containing protein [Geodermatophilus sp. URMC 63]
MPSDEERRSLAATFDRVASSYQRARPEYPDELYEHLLAVTGLPSGARLLEIGCATGKATRPLARRGFAITCLEPGPALAATARADLAGLDVEVVTTRFEDWASTGEPFAMVFAATAWHWLDPAVRYGPAAEQLRRIHGWVAGHLGDPGLDPAAVARAHHLSTRHLHRLFARQGTTVARHIRRERLERCRRELADPRGTAPVFAIARRWGFPDAAGLSRAFRQAYGTSPSEYRRWARQP